MAEDNQDQAREMAAEAQAKRQSPDKGQQVEGRGMLEQAKRLDGDVVSDAEMETLQEADPGLPANDEAQVDGGPVHADVRGNPPTNG